MFCSTALGEEESATSHTIDSRREHSDDDFRAPIRDTCKLRATKRSRVQLDVVDVSNFVVRGRPVATSDVIETWLLARRPIPVAGDTNAVIFSRAFSASVTDSNSVSDGTADLKEPFQLFGNDVDNNPLFAPSEVRVDYSRSSVVKVPTSSAEEYDVIAFQKRIWELAAENEDLSWRRAEDKRVTMNTLLKLSSDKKCNSILKSECKKQAMPIAEGRSNR